MTLNQKQVSQRVQYLMQKMKYNQKQMADFLQITQPAVSKYLKERIPPPFVLLKLAQSTGTTIEWILTGIQSPNPKHVSEERAIYGASHSLTQKIESLPQNIRSNLDLFIDSILESLSKR